jgi:glutathione peroxidase
MFKLLSCITLFCTATLSWASCPDYLDHSMRKLHSKDQLNLCQAYSGQPMLIINTASHCGYTPQFKDLEALHQQYGKEGLVVVGFASDDFKQEANDEAAAAEVCYVNYGVSFDMFAPSSVKGLDANPVFKGLARQSREPGWNFNKYLVDRQGKVVRHFDSNTQPNSKVLADSINSVL